MMPGEMRKGDVVSYMFDTGAMGLDVLYGVVCQAGPKTFTVCWESGIKNRVEQGRRGIKRIESEDLDEDARESVRRAIRAIER